MKVYHGGYMAVTKPEIIKSKFPKDFGEGFYCTQLETQSVRWASRYDTPVVSIYEYSPDETLKMLVFEDMTEEWLDFIDGILTREQFWVLAKFKHPTHQVCFCSQKALNTLQFIESKTTGNYGRQRR